MTQKQNSQDLLDTLLQMSNVVQARLITMFQLVESIGIKTQKIKIKNVRLQENKIVNYN